MQKLQVDPFFASYNNLSSLLLPSLFSREKRKKIGNAAVRNTSMRNCVLFKKTLQLAPGSRQQGPPERMRTFGVVPTKFRLISSDQGNIQNINLSPPIVFIFPRPCEAVLALYVLGAYSPNLLRTPRAISRIRAELALCTGCGDPRIITVWI